jgi:hypothetical protein
VDLARSLLVVSVLLALAPPASAAPGAGSGGALAQPLRQGEGGGALAPERYGSSAESRSSPPGAATVAAEAASADQEKPPRWGAPPPERDWAPYPSVAEQPDDEAAVGPVEARPGARAKAAVVKAEPAAETPDAGSTADGGFLPRAGLEIAALAAIGLGVLTLGVALRPRRRERARALR